MRNLSEECANITQIFHYVQYDSAILTRLVPEPVEGRFTQYDRIIYNSHLEVAGGQLKKVKLHSKIVNSTPYCLLFTAHSSPLPAFFTKKYASLTKINYFCTLLNNATHLKPAILFHSTGPNEITKITINIIQDNSNQKKI